MELYQLIVTLHIIFVGIWLVNIPAGLILKKQISINKSQPIEGKFISLYLLFGNLFSMLGSIGILITGVVMILINMKGYSFFYMKADHWLASKQIIMVVILFMTFFSVKPIIKKIKNYSLKKNNASSDEMYSNLKKLYKFYMILNILVVLNFIFAVTHRFFI